MKAVIRAAFEKTLADWAAAQAPAIPVAYENVAFKPPATGPYLRCFLLPAETVDNTMAGQLNEYRGLFQVNVVCTACTGPTDAEFITAGIAALYPAKSRMTFAGLTVMVATPMTCPDCVEFVHKEAVVCHHCGCKLTQGAKKKAMLGQKEVLDASDRITRQAWVPPGYFTHAPALERT